MKVEWTNETTTRIVSNVIVVSMGILLYFLLSNLGAIIQGIGWMLRITVPFILGIIIAFLLSWPTHFFENVFANHLFRKKVRTGSVRLLAITTTVIATVLIIGLVVYAVIPQLMSSVMSLINSMPGYIESANQLGESLLTKYHIDSTLFEDFVISWRDIVKKFGSVIGKLLPHVFDISKQITSGVANFLFGFIISIYLLAGKERFISQLKKLMFAIFPAKFVTASVRLARFTNKTFARYLSGQVLDAMILGIICFISMSIFRMEYALLISFLIAITNLIPFFGPFIGGIVGVFILLMVDPIKALWFTILIIVLQQIDGNVLAPRIVGKSTGLPAFWILFAICIGGGLFGFAGIILGVPTFSVFYVLIKNGIEKRLEKKGLPTHTASYNESERPI